LVDGILLHYDATRPSYTVRGLAMGTYERPTVALIKSTVRPGMTVVDLGAHIGYFSLLSAALVGPHGSVWSFEPDPDNRRMLEHNILANACEDRISVCQAAVGAGAGEATLYQFQADGSSSSLVARQGQLAGTLPVDVTTLDNWAESQGWPQVDLVKMDIEGGEVSALHGMGELCERNSNMSLVVEFNAEALEAGGVEPVGFFAALRDRGFVKTALIHERGLRPIRSSTEINTLAQTARWEPVNLFCRRGR
jgi:FkbM family methyltransferase